MVMQFIRNLTQGGQPPAAAEEAVEESSAKKGLRGKSYDEQAAALSPAGTAPAAAPAAASKQAGVVTAASLNVRDAPKGAKLGALKGGHEVEILSSRDGWAQIKFGDGTGWVSAKYVELRDGKSPHRPASGVTKRAFDANAMRLPGMKMTNTHDGELKGFTAHWKKHRARYEAVAKKVDLPAPLIAALHWRESSGDFGRYLHQGDKLGKPAVNVPKNIPVFHEWEPAAVHAIKMKSGIAKKLALDGKTKDLAAIATYAEMYNGLGYHNKGKASPYVYAGTNQYTKGKYVSDGKYSANTKDEQVGVMAMMQAAQEADAKKLES